MLKFLPTTIMIFASLSGNANTASFSCFSNSRYLVPSYVYTPNNTQVSTWDRTNEEFTSSEIATANNYISNHYPNASFLANASKIYNCHSYAWYMQSSQYNFHWMDSPSNYVLDNSY